MFTHTLGDPGRGERIAGAVLDDDAARSEVVGTIASSVMTTARLPADQRPLVDAQVDQLLRDPNTAGAFIDPFAGEWARMLGEDDPRPSEFDLAPLVDDLVASTPGLDPSSLPTDRMVVASVPLPRSQLPWLGGFRRAVEAAVLPLAIVAAAGFLIAFVLGERRYVLRRYGVWAALAGVGWVVVPVIAVWAASRWIPDADAVVSVAAEEAVSGLRPAALVLLASGLAAISASFALVFAPQQEDRVERQPTTPAARNAQPAPARAAPHRTQPMPVARPIAPPTTIPQPAPAAATEPDEVDADDLWKYYH